MADSGKRPGKLLFKGEAPKKKKKTKRKRDEDDDGTGPVDPDSWYDPQSAYTVLGPIFITFRHPSYPSCLAIQSNQYGSAESSNQVIPARLDPEASTSTSASNQALAEASSSLTLSGVNREEAPVVETLQARWDEEPNAVDHVWVCTRVPDSDDKVTLRSSVGRFLASDEIGNVSADREARGAQEEWRIVRVVGSEDDASQSKGKGKELETAEIVTSTNGTSGWALKSVFDKFASIDEVAGGKLIIRADSEAVGESELVRIRMQGKFWGKVDDDRAAKAGAKKKLKDGTGYGGGSVKGKEDENILKFQARGAGRLVSSAEDVVALKKARKDGSLGEAMLDRRAKLKSDRYAK